MSGSGPATEESPRHRPLVRTQVTVALMLSVALAALDGAIVATAVPQIAAALGGSSSFSWLFSGYLLAAAVTLPVYGRLADTLGRKPVLVSGIALFLAGSLLCAAAWSMESLIVFRVVQGLGGGALQGTVQTIAADLYPPEDRPKIQARLSSVWAVASVAGPGAGGVLAGYLGWRWIFLINLPVGLVALQLIARRLRDPAGRTGRVPRTRVDFGGATIVFVTGALLLTGLTQGGVAWPWLSWPSAALFGTAMAGAICATVVESRATDPIVPSWIWRRRSLLAANLAFFALGVLMVAPTAFIPAYAQVVFGLSPVSAGFVLSAMTVSWPISAALSSRVSGHAGFRLTSLTGITIALLTLTGVAFLPLAGGVWPVVVLLLLLGGGLGLFQLPLIVAIQSTVNWSERGTATGMLFFHRQLGESVGAALLGAVAAASLAGSLGEQQGRTAGSNPISRALAHPGSVAAADHLREAVSSAVGKVFLTAAAAAVLALAALLSLRSQRLTVPGTTPRRRQRAPDREAPPLDGPALAQTDSQR